MDEISDPRKMESNEFPDLPEIDVATGLRYAGGKARLYRKLLNHFGSTHARNFVADFRAALAAGDRSGAFRLAHSLKGMARTIGATGVGGQAEQLEATLRAGDAAGLEEALVAISQALERVLRGLSTVRESGEEN